MPRPRRDPEQKFSEPVLRTLSALESVEKMARNPDAPMPISIVAREGDSVTKLYEDGGARMRFSRELMRRSFTMMGRKWTPDEAVQVCSDYFEDCAACQMPATIGGLALYLGTTQKELDSWIRNGHPAARVFAHAKESIRLAMELAAMDGSITPLVYFHQQGAYHGYVQKNETTHRIEPIRLDPDEAEVDQIIAALPDAE